MQNQEKKMHYLAVAQQSKILCDYVTGENNSYEEFLNQELDKIPRGRCVIPFDL